MTTFLRHALRPPGVPVGAPKLGSVYDPLDDKVSGVAISGNSPDDENIYFLIVTFPTGTGAGAYDVKIRWDGNDYDWFIATI